MPLRDFPLWRNVVLRTLSYYLLVGAAWWSLQAYAPPSLGALRTDSLTDLVSGGAAAAGQVTQPPTVLATVVAMLTAFLASLPVAWIYTLTRRKKGFQQSVVQTYLILPVVAGGIIVLVKSSLQLAFALGGIVAAVRFRTSLDDSKDAAGIFVVIGIGIAAAVAPSVSWAISIGFNLLMMMLWVTDFGRAPTLEGKAADARMQRALATANRTGTFIARVDEEVLQHLAPEQLEALALRAVRRRKRNDPEMNDRKTRDVTAPSIGTMLRVKAADVAMARAAAEPRFDGLFSAWTFLGTVQENDLRVLEYDVTFAPTVTPGVVQDDLATLPNSPLRGVELR